MAANTPAPLTQDDTLFPPPTLADFAVVLNHNLADADYLLTTTDEGPFQSDDMLASDIAEVGSTFDDYYSANDELIVESDWDRATTAADMSAQEILEEEEMGDDEDSGLLETDDDTLEIKVPVEVTEEVEKEDTATKEKDVRDMSAEERKQLAKDTVDGLLRVIQNGIWHDRNLQFALSRRPAKGKRNTRKTLPVNEGLEVPDAEEPPRRREFKTIRYPGKNKDEEWMFNVVHRILEYIQVALNSGQTVTKRDIYYKDVALFRNQRIVDNVIDDLACTFKLSRHDLNITASAKGLIFGPLMIHLSNGLSIDCLSSPMGTLIPSYSQIESLTLLSKHMHLLIIEKDATFQPLASIASSRSNKALPLLTHQTILITARGQPDLSTRMFCNLLTRIFPTTLTSILTDLDPYGLSIAQTYKHGSARLSHERNTTLPDAKWVGLTPVDLRNVIRKNYGSEENIGLLGLREGEWQRCKRIVESDCGEELRDAARWMMSMRLKAEMEIINLEDMGEWVEGKLNARQEERELNLIEEKIMRIVQNAQAVSEDETDDEEGGVRLDAGEFDDEGMLEMGDF